VVRLKRNSSSHETDQGEQPGKVFIDRCQNGRSTCPPVEEQPQAAGATASDIGVARGGKGAMASGDSRRKTVWGGTAGLRKKSGGQHKCLSCMVIFHCFED